MVINVGKQSRLREMQKRINLAAKHLVPKKGQKLEFALINPVAPMGNSSTVIRIPGEKDQIKITMSDKVFVFPEKWARTKKEKLRERLLIEGWKDCSKCVDSVPQNKNDEPEIYIAGHPDNEPGDPKTGNFVLEYNIGRKKKSVKFQLKNGMIETTDKRIFKALLKQGFSDQGRKKIAEEDNPPKQVETDSTEENSDTGEEDIQFD